MHYERTELYGLYFNVGTVLDSSYDDQHCRNYINTITISFYLFIYLFS